MGEPTATVARSVDGTWVVMIETEEADANFRVWIGDYLVYAGKPKERTPWT